MEYFILIFLLLLLISFHADYTFHESIDSLHLFNCMKTLMSVIIRFWSECALFQLVVLLLVPVFLGLLFFVSNIALGTSRSDHPTLFIYFRFKAISLIDWLWAFMLARF